MSRPPLPVNRRRTPAFLLPENREKAVRLVLAALAGAVSFHIMLYALCWVFDINLSLHSQPPPSPQEEEVRVLVNIEPEKSDEPPPPDPVTPPEEIQHDDTIDPPDIVDVDIDDAIVAPGETTISLPDIKISEPSAQEMGEKLDLASLQKGLPDVPPDPGFVNENPVTIKAPDIKDVNMDEWYKEKLTGAGGADDSMNPDGSKSLNDLLNAPGGSLGENSGYSRIGADLLFEYDKAELKQSAHVGLLMLAALMEKNPTTRFIIEGHTDSFGNVNYNRKLSLLRADAVRRWLAGNGINLSRVYIRACAADSPVVSIQGDREAQSANRRVEIHMRKPAEALPVGSIGANAPLPADMSTLPSTASSSKGEQAAPAPAPKSPAVSPAVKKPAAPAAVPKKSPKSDSVGAEIIEEADSVRGAEIVD